MTSAQQRRHYRLDMTWTLKAPLSHKGQSIGTDSFLARDLIIGPDGYPVEVFTYSGNAVRGMLRDAGATYLLDRLRVKVPPTTFHLLFGGGSLSGDQKIDIEQARAYRRILPLMGVLGGGVGNQILGGKLRSGALYPVAKETQHLLPPELRGDAPSWRRLTFERTQTRMDDAKNESLRINMIEGASAPALTSVQSSVADAPSQPGTLTLWDAGPDVAAPVVPDMKPGKSKKSAAPKGEREPGEGTPQQMIYTNELLAAGSVLWGRMDLAGATELELGALVSMFHEWSKAPYLGGQSRMGCGLTDLAIRWRMPGMDPEPFLSVEDGVYLEQPAASGSRAAYDRHVAALYDQYIDDKQGELVKLLAGATA